MRSRTVGNRFGGLLVYLVDTYALMEWFVWENKNYKKYFEQIQKKKNCYVSEITLVELYHHIYHREGFETAEIIYSSVTNYLNVAKMNDEIIKNAGIFRSEMLKKKKSLSYADCINYTISKEWKIKLLTGDEDFKGLSNVEFVK
jgi:predicted nucleic acid-binding protein